MMKSISDALRGCRVYAAGIFIVYLVSCAVGIVMVHSGNQFALAQRDRIVGAALQDDKASANYLSGNRLTAALYDLAGNVFMAAIPQTVIGLGIVPPYFTVAYQGWVGGIVSVNGAHQSRFTNVKTLVYYLAVFLLQTIAFSLSIGAGIKCGVLAYRHNADISWKVWRYRIPREGIRTVASVYAVSIPLFVLGSLFEFFSSWNLSSH
jgi:hypothetical protein